MSKRFTSPSDMVTRFASIFDPNAKPDVVQAVDGVNLSIAKGEVVGLVGESGCGKSTLGRIAAGILPPSSGQVLWRGRDRETMSATDRKAANLAVQMIFQDPFSSLNPRMRVADIISQAPIEHRITSRGERNDYLADMMAKVGLDASFLSRYPHQLSGGQRQRVGIARALAVKPELMVCDEAIAALDVSIQAKIINLFVDIRKELDLTYLFISHDLATVEYISDRVVIMYLGRVIEEAPTTSIFDHPNHPYTKALLDEIPDLAKRKRTYSPVAGEIPSPLDPPSGCHFHPRCPRAFDRCRIEAPTLRAVAPGHLSACHLNEVEEPEGRTKPAELRTLKRSRRDDSSKPATAS